MALLQFNVSLDSPWPDDLIVGTPCLSVFGIGALFGRLIQPYDGYLLSGRSAHCRATSLVNLGAIEYRGHLRE